VQRCSESDEGMRLVSEPILRLRDRNAKKMNRREISVVIVDHSFGKLLTFQAVPRLACVESSDSPPSDGSNACHSAISQEIFLALSLPPLTWFICEFLRVRFA
jgi:hypothetical protein